MDEVTAPVSLRQYALVADRERGALIGPRGGVAFLCSPRRHGPALLCGVATLDRRRRGARTAEKQAVVAGSV